MTDTDKVQALLDRLRTCAERAESDPLSTIVLGSEDVAMPRATVLALVEALEDALEVLESLEEWPGDAEVVRHRLTRAYDALEPEGGA